MYDVNRSILGLAFTGSHACIEFVSYAFTLPLLIGMLGLGVGAGRIDGV
jgi:hypothetical protein